MIGKKEFAELIESFHQQDALVDSLCKVFSDSFGAHIIDWGFRMFDKLISLYFDEEGVDWIDYYLYENPEKCYYQDEKRIPLESIDDLWLLIESHRK